VLAVDQLNAPTATIEDIIATAPATIAEGRSIERPYHDYRGYRHGSRDHRRRGVQHLPRPQVLGHPPKPRVQVIDG